MGGGIFTAIRNSLLQRRVANSGRRDFKAQCFKIVASNQSFRFTNFYVPREVAVKKIKRLHMKLLVEDNETVKVDANAQSPFWYSNIADNNRGSSLRAAITDSDCTPLNDYTITRLPLLNLGSDQLTIFIGLPLTEDIPFYGQKKTFINFNKAKWDGFIEEIKRKL